MAYGRIVGYGRGEEAEAVQQDTLEGILRFCWDTGYAEFVEFVGEDSEYAREKYNKFKANPMNWIESLGSENRKELIRRGIMLVLKNKMGRSDWALARQEGQA